MRINFFQSSCILIFFNFPAVLHQNVFQGFFPTNIFTTKLGKITCEGNTVVSPDCAYWPGGKSEMCARINAPLWMHPSH